LDLSSGPGKGNRAFLRSQLLDVPSEYEVKPGSEQIERTRRSPRCWSSYTKTKSQEARWERERNIHEVRRF
jgi:hypothetical protein